MTNSQTQVAVIGAGPAGLMAAEVLAQGGADVTVYDAMPSAGRKFLMAGRGGLNLTHSEALPAFLARYREAMPKLATAIEAFPPDRLRQWSDELGQPTFVGSSGRVFPQAFKASPLLRAWLRRLDSMGVQLKLRHRWTGWDEQGRLLFRNAGRTAHARDQCHCAGARRRQLAEAPDLMARGRNTCGEGRDDIAAPPRQLRLHRRLVRHFSRSFRGPAAQGRRTGVRIAQRAGRSPGHAHRHRGRRDLRAVG